MQTILNDEETGLIKDIVDRNYLNVKEYPRATLSGVDDEDLVFSSQVDTALQQMGWKHDIPSMEERYARKYGRDEEETLVSPQDIQLEMQQQDMEHQAAMQDGEQKMQAQQQQHQQKMAKHQQAKAQAQTAKAKQKPQASKKK
jgi:hypothetical protein